MANTKSYPSRLRTLADDHWAAITRLSDTEREALRAGAAALDRLAQTCGTCQHADTGAHTVADWCYCAAPAGVPVDPRFPFRYQAMPLDERCKGWTKREDA